MSIFDTWRNAPVRLDVHEGITVVRDDLLEGGSKLRFLPFLTRGAQEIVYGSPFCGGAALALSVLGRESHQKITIFYAERKLFVPRQLKVKQNGARIIQVPYGYMTNVQAKARAYADSAGALFLPLGFDVPAASEPFVDAIRRARKSTLKEEPDEVWCATGSGMLARCLGEAFPYSEINAVAVGLHSRNSMQKFGPNVKLIPYHLDFAERTDARAPFPSCGHYDRKAWQLCVVQQRRRRSTMTRPRRVLFWNVMGD